MNNITIKKIGCVTNININSIVSRNYLVNFLNENQLGEILDNLSCNDDVVNPQRLYYTKTNNDLLSVSYYSDHVFVITRSNYSKKDSIKTNIIKSICYINGSDSYSEEDLNTARDLLMIIDKSKLKPYVDTNIIYYFLSIFPSVNYNYVAENNDIALSTRYKLLLDDMNFKRCINFDIILKETKEHVGNISITSEFEVSYYIKEKFRKNHYATNALELLINLLRYTDTKKDLTFIALNYISEQVIKNNNGEFNYMVPYMDGNYPKYSIKL